MDLLNGYLDKLSENKISTKEEEGFYVYALWNDEEVVYIGQTIDIGSRVGTHKRNKVFDKYSYFECKDQLEMDHVESYLIGVLDPDYNETTGHGMMSLQRVRKRIRRLAPEYEYSEKYYLKEIRKIINLLGIEEVRNKGKTYVGDMDAEKIIRYAKKKGCD